MTDAPPDAEGDSESESDRTVIRSGRDFERDYRLDATEAGAFLVALGESLRDGEEFTVVGDGWELPFSVGGPVELEIDYEGVGDPSLEIELDVPGLTDDSPPRVE